MSYLPEFTLGAILGSSVIYWFLLMTIEYKGRKVTHLSAEKVAKVKEVGVPIGILPYLSVFSFGYNREIQYVLIPFQLASIKRCGFNEYIVEGDEEAARKKQQARNLYCEAYKEVGDYIINVVDFMRSLGAWVLMVTLVYLFLSDVYMLPYIIGAIFWLPSFIYTSQQSINVTEEEYKEAVEYTKEATGFLLIVWWLSIITSFFVLHPRIPDMLVKGPHREFLIQEELGYIRNYERFFAHIKLSLGTRIFMILFAVYFYSITLYNLL